MDGYGDSTYGDAFADVYDEWYAEVSDVDATTNALRALALPGRPVLELGVGTGRLAVPLAATGIDVQGIDTSAGMLARLALNDPAGTVATVQGDMVDGLPAGPFGLVFVAYNTFFSLQSAQRQQACFHAVAQRLAEGGAFVIEAFVPTDSAGDTSTVSLRSLTATRVVLSVSVADAANQRAEGQYIEITETGGVRLRPWAVRYAAPAELDAMAHAAGLALERRDESFAGDPFTAQSERHVSVYRRTAHVVTQDSHSRPPMAR